MSWKKKSYVCLRVLASLVHSVTFVFNNYGVGEMVLWIGAPAALSEVLSSMPSNRIMAHNHI